MLINKVKKEDIEIKKIKIMAISKKELTKTMKRYVSKRDEWIEKINSLKNEYIQEEACVNVGFTLDMSKLGQGDVSEGIRDLKSVCVGVDCTDDGQIFYYFLQNNLGTHNKVLAYIEDENEKQVVGEEKTDEGTKLTYSHHLVVQSEVIWFNFDKIKELGEDFLENYTLVTTDPEGVKIRYITVNSTKVVKND